MKDLSNIKCIVISGGGAMFYQMLGIMNKLITNEDIKLNNITHFFGSSAGAILSVMLALNYEMDVLNNYLINRPWHNIIKTDIFEVISGFNKCGIINREHIIKCFESLFKGKDMDININLKDFFDKTQKEIHIYATNITDGICEDISHITHPEWCVIDAIHASVCIPTIVEPLIKNNKCYVDGGVVNNFPIDFAYNIFDKNQILGLKTESSGANDNDNTELRFDNMLTFIYYVIVKSHSKFIVKPQISEKLDNLFIIKKDNLDMIDIFSVFNSKDKRIEYFEQGKIIYDESI